MIFQAAEKSFADSGSFPQKQKSSSFKPFSTPASAGVTANRGLSAS
jgi:hypothetical protein